jgi:nucleoside recognition membrane protein YjiH
MRRIWSYWSFVILLILGIIFFSIAIAKAAEYQCHIPTDTVTYRIVKAPGCELQEDLYK